MNFKEKNLIVIGDIMLDKYIFGEVNRISPEAPVPIVYVDREGFVPGGAANAANNVASLTGNAFLMGIVGNDMAKDILLEESKKRGINTGGVLIDASKPTIQKIRVLGQNQQLLRIDYEDKDYAHQDMTKQIIEQIKNTPADAVIVSDYAKGTLTKLLMQEIAEHCEKNKMLLIIDPKPKHKEWYKGCYLITPNKKEAEEMAGMVINTKEDAEAAGEKLQKLLSCNVLLTLGEKGMAVFEKGKKPIHIPTVAKEVYDVSGAGDTVIATLGLALSSGKGLEEASMLANKAAGIKVGKVGTAPVTLEELER